MTSRHILQSAELAVLALVLLVVGSSPARADTLWGSETIANQFYGPEVPSGGFLDECAWGKVAIQHTASARSRIEAYYQASGFGTCLYPLSRPPGYLGVQAQTWKNGAFCDSTSWAYNSGTVSNIEVYHGGSSGSCGSGGYTALAYQGYYAGGAWEYSPGYWSPGHGF